MHNKDHMVLAAMVLMVVVIVFNAFTENSSTNSPKAKGTWEASSGNSEFYTLSKTDNPDGVTVRRKVEFSGPIYIWVEFETSASTASGIGGKDVTLTITNLTQNTTDDAVFTEAAGSFSPNIGLVVNKGDTLLINIKGADGTKYRFGYSQEYKANGAWVEE